MNEKKVKGRTWLIKDKNGKLIDNIDTDMIFHNSHLHIIDINEMGKHTFGNLEGWKDFPGKAKKGDIVIIGENFGSGSSRQQAVDCFASLGVIAIIAKSYGAIYKRNAINSAMPILACSELEKIRVENGQEIELNFETGEIKTGEGKTLGKTEPMNKVQLDIYRAGSLFKYARSGC